MHRKKLRPFHHANVPDVESPVDAEMSEKMQQLSVSQDYREILADQYQTAHAHDGDSPQSNNGALFPPPLSWKKDSTGSLPNTSQPTRELDSRKRYRNMTNWVPFP
jgi:hypothetical protein